MSTALESIDASTARLLVSGTEAFRFTSAGINSATLVSGTAQATTSGTSIDFTGIPTWVKRITVMFAGVSTNGGSNPVVQIGDAGGVEATAYLGAAAQLPNAAAIASVNLTTGFPVLAAVVATSVIHGSVVLSLLNASTNTWVSSSTMGFSDAQVQVGAGSKSLSATLDRVRITMVNGTDTFDAGSINILYE